MDDPSAVDKNASNNNSVRYFAYNDDPELADQAIQMLSQVSPSAM
jgi:hypothetical protein